MITSYLGSLGVKIAAILLIVVGLVLYRAYLIHQIDVAKMAATTAQAQLIAERANETTLKDALDQQNIALAQLTRQEEAAQQAEAAAAAKITQNEPAVAEHTHAILSANVGSDCEEAIKWLNSQAPLLARY